MAGSNNNNNNNNWADESKPSLKTPGKQHTCSSGCQWLSNGEMGSPSTALSRPNVFVVNIPSRVCLLSSRTGSFTKTRMFFSCLSLRHAVLSTPVYVFSFPVWTGDLAINTATHKRHPFSSSECLCCSSVV